MRQFISSESGASLVEYGLLVGLIAIAAMTALQSLGAQINNLFGGVSNELGKVIEDMQPDMVLPG